MGFENLSPLMRMGVVIGTTAFVLIMLFWLISRRRRKANAGETGQKATDIAVNPSKDNNAAVVTADPAQSKSKGSTEGKDKSSSPNPAFLGQNVTDNLATILKLSELIAKTGPSNEIKQYGRKILNAASETSLLFENTRLSLLSQDQTPDTQPGTINFKELINALRDKWSTMATTDQVKFTCFVDEQIPECLFMDAEILKKIISALLSNSRKMTSKGRIHLHFKGENTEDYNWNIKMIVADTGEGFETTTKSKVNSDTGFETPDNAEEANLLAARKLTRTINGTFVLKSVPGRGTEASVTFPARAAMVMSETQKNKDNSLPVSAGSLAGRRVLIIEDDKSSQEVLKTFLQPEGCEIDCIDDGMHAIESLTKQTYDLVLMDVRMNGLDGIKTTRAIRRSDTNFKDVPIIAITADTSPETNAKCMMAGVDLFLTKPVGAKGLFDAIRFVMDLGADIRSAAHEATG